MKLLPRSSDTNVLAILTAALILGGSVETALLAPASAEAAVTFGADLSQSPNWPTSSFSLVNVTDPGGTTDTGAPQSGVLTAVRIRTRGAGGSGVIRILSEKSHPDLSTYGFFNDPPEIPVTVTADATLTGHITQVLTRRPIAAGQHLGWYTNDPGGTIREDSSDPTAECAYTTGSDSGPGTTQSYFTSGCNENVLLVSGTIENDFDHDVFGDETQDKCVGTAGSFNGCPNTVSSVSAAQAGHKPKIRVTATVPGAGTLEVGSANDASVASAASAVSLKPVTQTLTSTSSRQVTLTLKLTKSAKSKLARKGKLKTSVRIVYTPPGGPAGSIKSKVSLKGAQG